MSVDPKETAAFANILGKLDGVSKGHNVVDIDAGVAKRMADNDMTAILSKFHNTSGTSSALTLESQAIMEDKKVDEVIRKLPDQDKYRLYSKDGKKNLGTFDTRKAAEKHEREVQYFKHMGEQEVQEDTLSDVKARLSDYLQDIKAEPQEDFLGKPIKTISLKNGKKIVVHGNEDDGFRLKVNGKLHSATFDDLGQALMACEAYMNKLNGK